MAPDPVYDSIGESGTWQVYLLMLICLSKFPTGWHQLSTVFLSLPVDHWCKDPGNDTDVCSPDCKEVEYDRSIFEQTMIMEWDLICDKSSLANFEQTIFMMGILTGSVFFGVWADKSGRRITILASSVLQLVSGCLAAFAPWFALFSACRFFCAVATGGNMLTTFCLLMEIFGPYRRELYTSLIFQLPFNIGHVMVSVFAYYFRHFRAYQLAMSSFSVCLLSYFCFVPESPRWLIIHNKPEEAIALLEKIATFNGTPTDGIRNNVESAIKARASKGEIKKASVFDLMKTPNLRRNTLCTFYNWFAVGFNFFGVSQYIGRLEGSVFINVAVGATFSVPGLFISFFASKILGRKPSMALSNFGVCLFMIIYICTPEQYDFIRLIVTSCALSAAFMLFPLCYLYAGEIFPTIARNSAIGVASVLARLGAMTSAHISRLMIYGRWVPAACFAFIAFIGFIMDLFLPETLNEPLPETLEDAENFKKKV